MRGWGSRTYFYKKEVEIPGEQGNTYITGQISNGHLTIDRSAFLFNLLDPCFWFVSEFT